MEQLDAVEQTESRDVYEIAGFPEDTALLLASADAILKENLSADAAELLMNLLGHSRQVEYLPLLKRTELQYFPAADVSRAIPPHIAVITKFYDPNGELLSAQNFTVLEESDPMALDAYGVLDYTLNLPAIQQHFFGRAE